MGQGASWKYISVIFVVCLQAGVHLVLSYRADHSRVGFTASSETVNGIRLEEVEAGLPASNAGIQAGDIIIAVAGNAVHNYGNYSSIKLHHLKSGHPAEFLVLRNGEKLTFSVIPISSFQPVKFLVGVLLVLLCLVLGIFCYFRNPADPRTRMLLLIFLSFAGIDSWLTGSHFGNWPVDQWIRAAYEALDGISYGLLTLLPFFVPERKKFLEERPWLASIFLLPGFFFAILNIWNSQLAIYKPGTTIVPEEWLVAFSEYYLKGIFLSMPLVLLHTHRTATTPRVRAQAKTMLVGVTLWALLNSGVFALQEIYPESWIADSYYALIVDIIIPVSVFFAIFKHHLFDIDVLIRKGLIYTAASGVLFAIYFLGIGIVGWLVAAFITTESNMGMMTNSLSTLLVGLAFIPVRRLSQRMIDRMFYRQKYNYLHIINTIYQEIPSAFSLGTLVETLSNRVYEAMRIKNLAVLIPDEEHSRFLLRSRIGKFPGDDLENRVVLSGEESLVQTLISTGSPLYGKALEQIQMSDRERQTLELLGSRLILPVLHQGKPVAILMLGEKQSETWFDGDDLNFLTTVARQAAMLLENARLFELATYDGLTQLMRRNAFDSMLEAELQRARRYGRPISLIMLDIDHFKKLNDTFGHQTGDLVIKRIAATLRVSVRKTDTASRYGGEEFAILLPEAGTAAAQVVAENLRTVIESMEVIAEDGRSIPITASLGVCSTESHGVSSAEELYKGADIALYRAKSAGRNRVEAAAGPDLAATPVL